MSVRQKQTLTERAIEIVRRQIASGSLHKGDRLPSIREFMALHRMAKNTVLNAYGRLVKEGLIESHHGAGFFVTGLATQRIDDSDTPRELDRAMDNIWLMREQLVRNPGPSRLGEGFPPAHWLKEIALERHYRKAISGGSLSAIRYGYHGGYPPLREQLAQKLADHEIDASPDNILTTSGVNSALDLIIRFSLAPGDSVMIDDPGYYLLFGKLRLGNVRMLPVPRLADGPDLDAVSRWATQERPKLFFTQSVSHNPTGSTTSPSKSRTLLALARKHNFTIVENDALAEFGPPESRRVASLGGFSHCIYVGSFSKSISAGLRSGFIACDRALAEGLADLNMLINASTSEISERTLALILEEGSFRRHALHLAEHATRAVKHGLAKFDEMGAEVFCRPETSLYLWARFPGIDDADALARYMLEQNFVLAPGSIFSVALREPVAWSRFNVAYVDNPDFRRMIESYRDQGGEA